MRIVHAYHRRKTAVDWNFSTKERPDPVWILDAETRYLMDREQSSHVVKKSGIKTRITVLLLTYKYSRKHRPPPNASIIELLNVFFNAN